MRTRNQVVVTQHTTPQAPGCLPWPTIVARMSRLTHQCETFSRRTAHTSDRVCSRHAQHRARRGCRRRVYNKRRCSAARRGRTTTPAAITVVAAIPAPAHLVDHPTVFPRRPARDASLHRVVLVAAGACERGRFRRPGDSCASCGACGPGARCRWWGNAPSGAHSRLLSEAPVVLKGGRRHRHPEVTNEALARYP